MPAIKLNNCENLIDKCIRKTVILQFAVQMLFSKDIVSEVFV